MAAWFLLVAAAAGAPGWAVARNLGRQREFALRIAAGASRRHLSAALMLEHLLVAAGAAGAGLLAAAWIAPLVERGQPLELAALAPFFTALHPTGLVAARIVVVALVSGLVVGLIAALPALRLRDPAAAIRDGGHTATIAVTLRLYQSLTAAQVGVSLVLATAAAALLVTYARLNRLDLGFEPRGVHFWVTHPPRLAFPDPADRLRYFDDLLGAVRALPGVAAAGLSSNVPLEPRSFDVRYEVDGGRERPAAERSAVYRLVAGDYREALGLRLVAGRFPGPEDGSDAPRVVAVSRAFAREEFGDGDPLGRRVMHAAGVLGGQWMTIVGVVDDVREEAASFRTARPAWYIPWTQEPIIGGPRLVVRFAPGGESAAAQVEEILDRADPRIGRDPAVRLADLAREATKLERFAAAVLGVVALLALALVTANLAGVVALAVAHRRREFAIRLALGARVQELEGRTLAQELGLVAAGAAVGLAVLAFAGPLARPLLLVGPGELVLLVLATLAGVAALTAAAAWLPARRIRHLHPAETLRAE